jgi:hypothetical protein
MVKKRIFGTCRICETLAALSSEHVPPKASPNKNTHILVTLEEAVRLGPGDIPKGPKQQGGVTYTTICGRCNNFFGRVYVPSLNEWYWGGRYILQRAQQEGLDVVTFSAADQYPLRIIKAIIAMFMAINPERFRQEPVGAGLATLLLDRHATGLPRGVRFFTYFNYESKIKYVPVSVRLSGVVAGAAPEDIKVLRLSELTYPPYGFVMVLGDGDPDPRLTEISRFAKYAYDEQATLALELAVLPVHGTVLPNDYRTREEWKADEERNVQAAIEMGIDPTTIQSEVEVGL